MQQFRMSYIIGFLLTLSVVVFVHELGHYLVAIRNGVGVEEFSIGFGKAIFALKDKKGTVWKVSIIPFGGYVKMAGETQDHATLPEDSSPSKSESFFQNKTNFTKIKVLLAGPFANYIFSFLVFFFSFWLLGVHNPDMVVMEVLDGPAKEAGLLAGDQILRVNDKRMEDLEQFTGLVQSSTREAVRVEYKRNGGVQNVNIKPSKSSDGKYRIGVNVSIAMGTTGFAKSVKNAFLQVVNINIESAKAIKDIILGRRSLKELSGPIKIAQYSGVAFKQGITAFFSFLGFLSVSLGFMNLLPIPLLDGGQVLIYAIEMIYRKKLPKGFYNVSEKISTAILIFLTLFVVFNDALSFLR